MASREARRPAASESPRCTAGVCPVGIGWCTGPDLRPTHLPDEEPACASMPRMRRPARNGCNDARAPGIGVARKRGGGGPSSPARFPSHREAGRVGLDTGWRIRVSCVEARLAGGFGIIDGRLGSETDLRRTLMAAISCPKCNTLTERAGYPLWVILLCICLFPVGLFALLAGRKPTTCGNCRFTWQA